MSLSPTSLLSLEVLALHLWISASSFGIFYAFVPKKKANIPMSELSIDRQQLLRKHIQMLQLHKQAQERKAALRKIPEQVILSEVRHMVEEMQASNQKLKETEAAIEEYFKPVDKQAQCIMNMQLEGEEKRVREMMKSMHEQALLVEAEAAKMEKVCNVDSDKQHSDHPLLTIKVVM